MTARVFAAAVLGAALACSVASAAMKEEPAIKAEVPKPVKSRELDRAVDNATKLGRPLAIFWTSDSTCRVEADKVAEWKTLKHMKYFVLVTVSFTVPADGVLDLTKQPEFISKMYTGSAGKQGSLLPIMFLGTVDGEFLGVVPTDMKKTEAEATLRRAAAKFGPQLPLAAAAAVWKKLQAARKHWRANEIGSALVCYRTVLACEKVNPKLPILAEVEKDADVVNAKGSEFIEKAEELLDAGKRDEAEALLRRIGKAFEGFEVADEAKAVLGELVEDQGEQSEPDAESL